MSNGEEIEGTKNHPVWAMNIAAFLGLKELENEDVLDTLDGPPVVTAIDLVQSPQPVYNIEVASEHVYQMGQSGVLVHNVGEDCSLVQITSVVRSAWEELPVLRNGYGAAEFAAGSFIDRRIEASNKISEGNYKFIVDKDCKTWFAKVTEDISHSALVSKGEGVRGTGYVSFKNGKANVNGRSVHFIAERPFLGEKAGHTTKAFGKLSKNMALKF